MLYLDSFLAYLILSYLELGIAALLNSNCCKIGTEELRAIINTTDVYVCVSMCIQMYMSTCAYRSCSFSSCHLQYSS